MAYAPNQHHEIIDFLYSRYQANGFITEDEALDLMIEHSLPLSEVDRVTEQLLAMGVLIRNEPDDLDDPGEGYDRTRTNYDEIFSRVIEIDPGLSNFIEEIRAIQAPQHREWSNLLPQAKAGNEYAYNRLFQMYLRNVVKIALWYHDKNDAPLADAIQDGCIGLMTAIEKFEYGKQDLFTTYAPWWVRQVINRNFMDTARTIRLPAHMFETMLKISHISKQFFQDYGCEPLLKELASKFGEPEDKVSEILKHIQTPISLAELDESELSDCGVFVDEMLENICNDTIGKCLIEVLNTLSPREKKVLMLRSGMDTDEPMTLEEVGRILKVTRERIRQIEKKAKNKIQHPGQSKKLKVALAKLSKQRELLTE